MHPIRLEKLVPDKQMLSKRTADLTFADIEQLARDKIAESRTLEFKRELPGAADDAKREFLADVSAFANANGGDLIYGIVENRGVAESAPGIEVTNPDDVRRRMGQLIRTGLDPKLLNFDIEWLPANESKGALILRIPRSWLMPHRVTLRHHDKFYIRDSTGKHPMDVDELRNAFNLSQTIFDRLQRFRDARLEKIATNSASIAVWGGPKFVFHLLPLISFVESIDIRVGMYTSFVLPMGAGGGNPRYTSEGFALCSAPIDLGEAGRSYSLMFRSGRIECVTSVGYETPDGKLVDLGGIEQGLQQAFPSCRSFLEQHGIEPPLVLSLSLMDIDGSRVPIRPAIRSLSYPCRERTVVSEEQITTKDQLNEPTMTIFRRAIDVMWNAFGIEASPNFDRSGNWTGRSF